MERKKIPKTVRFEVFKRDSFVCQYCGLSAPDALLEIDHIVPVSKGGDNSLLNLITSCRDCNRGKTNRELTDNSVVKVQKNQLDDLQKRKELMEMMVEWKKGLLDIEEQEINAILDYFKAITGISKLTFTDVGRADIRRSIKRFGFQEVYTATEISFNRYYDPSDIGSCEEAFYKIGGICYNRKKKRDEDAE